MNQHTVDVEHLGWADGSLSKSEDFPYDEIDRGNPLAAVVEEATCSRAGDALARVFAWCFRDGNCEIEAAFKRFVAVAMLVNPEWLDNETFKEVGARLNVTRANMSKIACEFQDTHKIKFRRTRGKDGRDNMAVSARGNRNRVGSRTTPLVFSKEPTVSQGVLP